MRIRMRMMQGLTLIELMVSLAISMLLMAGVLAFYVDTLQSNALTLSGSRLNQETSALVHVMSNEVRRAGYNNGNSDAFNDADNELTVIDDMTSNSESRTGGECIVFSYDRDRSGTRTGTTADNEVLGFRLNSNDYSAGVVEMRTSGTDVDDCTDNTGTWVAISDPNVIDITLLNFAMDDPTDNSPTDLVTTQSHCINSSVAYDPADVGASYDTYSGNGNCNDISTAAGIFFFKRYVNLTLQAQLVSDELVSVDIDTSIKVRNNIVQVIP